jgi:hypothetical protein
MKNELIQKTNAIAVRLQTDRDDVVTRAWAEQDLRALCIGYAIRGLGTSCAAVFRACANALRSARAHVSLQEENRPALR